MQRCRICADDGFYDIFKDELSIENKKNIKIYIVLNNFLFEKLYASDEHSSSICQNCCENLYNSYHFMQKVRDSEQNLRKEPAEKKAKLNDEKVVTIEAVEKSPQEETIEEEFYDNEELFTEQVNDEEDEDPKESITAVDDEPTEVVQECVTFNKYSLEFREENRQKYVSVRIEKCDLKKSNCESHDFSVPTHSDPDAIYSCNYCIKAFGNFDLLMKHLCCHLCSTCLEIFPTYKELVNHMKNHQKNQITCPICEKNFNSSFFRPHLKKQHVPNLPSNVHLLSK